MRHGHRPAHHAELPIGPSTHCLSAIEQILADRLSEPTETVGREFEEQLGLDELGLHHLPPAPFPKAKSSAEGAAFIALSPSEQAPLKA
jgi:hypothetical protein